MLKRSIRQFLLISLFSLVTLSGVFNTFLIYHESKEQVEELFDAELAQLSRVLQSLLTGLPKQGEQLQFFDEAVLAFHFDDEQEYSSVGHQYERKIAIQLWRMDGTLILANHLPLPKVFSQIKEGYDDIRSGDNHWRTFTLKDDINQLWIRVAQREDVRTELTSEIAREGIIPGLLIIPIVLLLAAVLIGRGLSPLTRISRELRGRSYDNLSPISDAHSPEELRQVVEELNELFNRVSTSYEREKRFTSDAAHELRTPLSITKVHLQNVQQISDGAEVKSYVAKALKGVERLAHLVEQLLVLSRLEAGHQAGTPVKLNVTDIVKELLEDVLDNPCYSSLAVSSELEDNVCFFSDEMNFRILLRNLIDNACRYSDGQVDIRLRKNQLELFNSCTPVPDEVLESLFERFKRLADNQSDGSGLGLSICKEISEQTGCKLKLINQTDPEGIKTLLLFEG